MKKSAPVPLTPKQEQANKALRLGRPIWGISHMSGAKTLGWPDLVCITIHNLNDLYPLGVEGHLHEPLLSSFSPRMSEPTPELIGRLRELVAQVVRETDPQKYDELASELWRALERIEHHRTATPKNVA